MSDYFTGELVALFSNTTKRWIGSQDRNGQEQIGGPSIATVILVSASRALTVADDGNILELTNPGLTLTLPAAGLPFPTFSCAVIANGTTTIASDGTSLINGSTSSVTRTFANNPMFAIQMRSSASGSYVVSGL